MAKAWKVKGIAPHKSLRACARRVITHHFHRMMACKNGCIDGTDIEFVHDMRVASRRLRAAMQNFSDCFASKRKAFRRHLKQIERITSTLGGVRDLDVLIDRFQNDAASMPAEERAGVENLIQGFRQERCERRELMLKMFDELDTNNYEKTFLKFFEV